jgi:hypothetical protein
MLEITYKTGGNMFKKISIVTLSIFVLTGNLWAQSKAMQSDYTEIYKPERAKLTLAEATWQAGGVIAGAYIGSATGVFLGTTIFAAGEDCMDLGCYMGPLLTGFMVGSIVGSTGGIMLVGHYQDKEANFLYPLVASTVGFFTSVGMAGYVFRRYGDHESENNLALTLGYILSGAVFVALPMVAYNWKAFKRVELVKPVVGLTQNDIGVSVAYGIHLVELGW